MNTPLDYKYIKSIERWVVVDKHGFHVATMTDGGNASKQNAMKMVQFVNNNALLVDALVDYVNSLEEDADANEHLVPILIKQKRLLKEVRNHEQSKDNREDNIDRE